MVVQGTKILSLDPPTDDHPNNLIRALQFANEVWLKRPPPLMSAFAKFFVGSCR